ncbi:MAG: exodeoxyribonuclease VII large subunit [Chthoniobacteraceae bacterium]|jgi:exodeoxyribonuclease VII large subunit
MELDLFAQPPPPPPEEPRIWSISDLTRSVRSLLESSLGEVWVQGEICNFRKQASGHCYFGLKDERALLSCVLFRSSVPARFALADGMLIQARGRVTVYEARGQYQLNVNLIQPAGAGLLQARFEALKRKLEAEGLFDSARKRPIPSDPATIGIVTSPTGAALQDFLNIARRRAPWVRVVINPVRVQGDGAAAEIAAAIREFNGPFFEGKIDLLVVCRGGGSIEDLWAFNEEIVARAIADSRLPVISAVGHEVDFTIADFVADLRAPTPSAAAELALPDRAALLRHLAQARTRLARAMENMLLLRRRQFEGLAHSAVFRFPMRLLQDRVQRLDAAAALIETRRERGMLARRERLAALLALLRQHRPDQVIALRRLALAAARGRIDAAARTSLTRKGNRVAQMAGVLRVLSPDATLARGYSITFDSDGSILRSKNTARRGERIRTQLRDGSVDSEVL